METVSVAKETFLRSIHSADHSLEPYPNWSLSDMMPADYVDALVNLPFPAPALEGVSGTREVHNKSRVYFDEDNRGKHPVCEAFAQVFQDSQVISEIASVFGADLNQTYLRIEYAQDTNGFWLQPHTDIGVKRFTLLYYFSDNADHADLGTDIYADADTWVGRSTFEQNRAFVFVPSNKTWHGFEPRTIEGVRKSIIVNYVTQDWRAREQLAFADQLIEM